MNIPMGEFKYVFKPVKKKDPLFDVVWMMFGRIVQFILLPMWIIWLTVYITLSVSEPESSIESEPVVVVESEPDPEPEPVCYSSITSDGFTYTVKIRTNVAVTPFYLFRKRINAQVSSMDNRWYIVTATGILSKKQAENIKLRILKVLRCY